MLGADFPEWQRHLFTDPQTSGGLLIACDADRADTILQQILEDGYPFASIVGRVEKGAPAVKM
jgi:selenide,water dikinase